MSASAAPISAALFAEAIKDLPASSLHYKALELRNSIAHLDYSNQQLLPYTDGTNGEPDPDCVDAIKENEAVIERHNERLGLLRVEVEDRGMNWREFASAQELEEVEEDNAADTNGDMVDEEGNLVNGHAADNRNGTSGTDAAHTTNGTESRAAAGSESVSSPWTDGTFTTGTISNGNISIDSPPQRLVVHRVPSRSIEPSGMAQQYRTDAELRRAMMELTADESTEEADGIHL